MSNQLFVLSCLDGSNMSQAVCDYAAWVAKSVNAPLRLLHTIEHRNIPAVSDLSGTIGLGASEELLNELTQIEESRSQLLIKKGKLVLQAAKERALKYGVETVNIEQRHGNLSETLVDMEDSIRLLVVGIRGEQHDESKSGVGTQLESVVRSLHKPILVVNKTFEVPRKIMLAYDGSDAAKKALSMVASSLLFKTIPCHLIHVVGAEAAQDPILHEAEQTLRDSGISVTGVMLRGKIEEVLTAYQAENNIDLTVMGAFSHNRVRDFLLGSFTAKMLTATQRPLLLLR